MSLSAESPTFDLKRDAEVKVRVAKELQTLTDQAIKEAKIACERAETLPLLEQLAGGSA